MRWAYTFAIRVYTWLIALASSFDPKARMRYQGVRDGKRSPAAPLSERPIWFHCASLGEFEQGRPLIERCKSENPGRPILLTFFSPSGYEVRKNYPGADRVVYLPPDIPASVSAFLDFWDPVAAVFVKYEVWQNFFRAISKRGIPLFMVSAIFRPQQVYFKFWGKWFRGALLRVNKIFTQDDHSVELLKSIGIENVEVAGDTRFDRVATVATTAAPVVEVERFIGGKTAVVAGSTWPEDEILIAEYRVKDRDEDIVWVIAPHEMSSGHKRKLEELFGEGLVYYSSLGENEKLTGDVLIIDTIGLLSALYRYGTINYVGGGFGAGIHNTLEPAVYGKPILFGSRHEKFKEANDLIAKGGAFSIGGQGEFDSKMRELFKDDVLRQKAGNAAGEYVQSNLGATERIMAELRRHL